MADIIHRIGIRAPLARVHEAVSTVQGVAGWWTEQTTGSAEPGGRVNVRFLHKGGEEIGQMDFEVYRRNPAGDVRWRFHAGPPEWLSTEVTFELKEEGEMTVVLFGHRNWKEPVEFMAHCSMKWAVFLLSLRDYVEKGKGQAAPNDLKIDTWN